MSGAEATAVLGVISSIIAIINGTKQVYDAAKDAGGLPEAFRVVAGRLPIVLDILDSTKDYIDKGNINEESCRAVKGVVEECQRKAKKLDEIFQKICPEDDDMRLERYYKAVKTIGKGNKIENLMKGIMEDVQLLACERGIKIANKSRIEQVSAAITEVAALPSSVPEQAVQETGITILHSGSGTQYNAQGEYIAQGEARQYNSSGGTMNFGEHHYYHRSFSYSNQATSSKDYIKCLAALFLTKPKDDREGLLSTKGSRVDGTCIWIKDNASYRTWLCSAPRPLWLSGGPGKGKTMLSIFLSEELEHLTRQSHGTILLEYYCDNKNNHRNSAIAILRGLLYQLLESCPSLFKHIQSDFEIRREKLFGMEGSSFPSLWKIFCDMVQDPDLQTVYCVLDGLDECDEDSLKLLLCKLKSLFLTELGPNTVYHLKMILISRDLSRLFPEIVSGFPCITLDMNGDAKINNDIDRFIEVKINELSEHRQYPDQLCAHVKDVFRKGAQGTFLWIGIVAQELSEYVATEVEEALKSFPRGLEPLFARMLLQIKPERRQTIAQILRWVVVAARPLTVLELSIALKQSNHDHDHNRTVPFSREEVMRDQISSCGFLLNITEDTVNLVHQSVKDYLLRKTVDSNAELEAFRIKEDEGHLELARRCFYYLQDVALIDEEPVKNPQTFRMRSARRKVLPEEFPLLSYAIQYWPMHASTLGHNDDIFDVSHRFYKDPKFCAIWRAMYCKINDTYFNPIPYNLLHIALYFNLKVLAKNIISEYGSSRSKKSSGTNGLLNKADRDGSTALHLAAERGYVAICKRLLNKHADIGAKDEFRRTALHVAASFRHRAVVRLLLDRGPSTEAEDSLNETPLHCAAQIEHRAIVRLLLDRGASTEAKELNKETPLHCAVRNEAVVELLLDRGASIEARNSFEETPLYRATRGRYSTVVGLLLDRGASTEAKNSSDETPLHCATRIQDIAIMKLLLGRGAFVDAENVHGTRPLYIAANLGSLVMLQLLLRHRADINAKNEDESTPLHFAARSGNEELVQLLLKRGAFIEAKNLFKMMPLHYAAQAGCSAVVQVLLLHKVDVNSRDFCGRTTLHLATECKAREIVELLLDNGADLEMKCRKGRTALHKAAKSGCLDIVEVLIDRGAFIDAQDKSGCTAVHHAAKMYRTVTLRHLLARGASTEIENCDGLTVLQAVKKSDRYDEMATVRLIEKFQNNGNANEQDEEDYSASDEANSVASDESLSLGSDDPAQGRTSVFIGSRFPRQKRRIIAIGNTR